MTGSATYLRRLAILAASVLLYWLLMSTLSRMGQGVLLGVHGLAAVLVGVAVAYRRRRDELRVWTIGSAGLIPFSWGLAELGWAASFFLFDRSTRSPLVVLATEFGYVLAFALIVVCMLSALEGKLRAFFARGVAIVPLLLTTPIAFRLILDPFLVHRDTGLTAFNLGEAAAIGVSYLALNLALLVLISSRSLDWSIFAAGILCLVFGDWSLRVDKIIGQRIEFGLPSAFIIFGLYAASLPFLGRERIGRIQRFEPTSILNGYRFGLLVVALSMVLVYALSQREAIRSLRILCLGSGAVAFVAVFLSQIMVERVQWFSTEIGRVLRSELEQSPQAEEVPDASLPVELREIYRLAFSSTIREQKLRAEQRSLEQLRRVQAQVAHDIRSPLAALHVALSTLGDGVPEDSRRVLRSAAGRIRDIANDLIEETRPAASDERGEDAAAVYLLSSLIEEVVSEKCLQHSAKMGVEIDLPLSSDVYGLFVKLQAAALKRVLSNLIDNAVESLKGMGKVSVDITTDGPQIILCVTDNGQGIPEEIRARLGERGFTHGKASGKGLGLHHARTTVEAWGGALTIRSEVGAGTTVEVRLPPATAPAWFIDKLALTAGLSVLVLDDDKAIHATWEQVLAAPIQAGVKVLHFAESRSFQEWLALHRESPFIALVDYELLREQVTGLDIIEREGIAQRAILVTSRCAEPGVLRRASALGLKILPKGLVGQIPIVIAPGALPAPVATSPGVRVLVVDDDEMIAWGWRKKRQRLGIAELATFASMEACEAAGLGYESFDLAFVDLNIEGTRWPIDKTISYLRQRGVRRVFIASGSPEALTITLDQKADGVAAEKIPEDLATYLTSRNSGP